MDTYFVTVIVSSTVVAAIVSGLVAALSNWRLAQSQYRNEYFKVVVNRRVGAYENVERLIASLKTAVLDEDKRLYHYVLCGEGDTKAICEVLIAVTSNTLWLSQELISASRQINQLVLHSPVNEARLVAYCKENYEKVAELRAAMEKAYAKDMLSLHDVKGFLKKRSKITHEFEAIRS